MAKKATQAVAPVEITDDLLAAYEAAEQNRGTRTISAGKNVPYDDVIDLLRLILPKLRENGKEIVVSNLKVVITEQIEKKYNAMPEGMDRITIRVGKELVEMTKSEAKAVRLEQLKTSKKNNMVYRYIYGYIRK